MEKIKVPPKKVKSRNFTVRFTDDERSKLERFCALKKTTIAEFIRFSCNEVMKRAK
jgi:hypothetical protein